MKYLEYPQSFCIKNMCIGRRAMQGQPQATPFFKAITSCCFLTVKEGLVSLFLLQPLSSVNLSVGSEGRKAQRSHHEGQHASHYAVAAKSPSPSQLCTYEGSSASGLSQIGVIGSFNKCCVQQWCSRPANITQLVFMYVSSGIYPQGQRACYSPCPSSRIWLN